MEEEEFAMAVQKSKPLLLAAGAEICCWPVIRVPKPGERLSPTAPFHFRPSCHAALMEVFNTGAVSSRQRRDRLLTYLSTVTSVAPLNVPFTSATRAVCWSSDFRTRDLLFRLNPPPARSSTL